MFRRGGLRPAICRPRVPSSGGEMKSGKCFVGRGARANPMPLPLREPPVDPCIGHRTNKCIRLGKSHWPRMGPCGPTSGMS